MIGPVGWFVYVLRSPSSGATYVGIATEPERRLEEHNGLRPGGARRTRAGRPWQLAACAGPWAERGAAQAVEARIKKRRGARRIAELEAAARELD